MSIDIKALAKQIATQDNCYTADPIFVVFQKREIVVDGDYGYSREAFIDTDAAEDSEVTDETKINRLQLLEDNCRLPDRYKKVYLQSIDKFVTACFTEQGANDYIKACGHRLNKPFTYADSLHRNREMIGLREYILSNREQ